MSAKTVLGLMALLLVFVVASCILSESSWSERQNRSDSMYKLLGLPTLITGNLNPSARNPGLELFCTSIYDLPGGYCNYFTAGAPPEEFRVNINITVSGIR